jgi:hypothetical protein
MKTNRILTTIITMSLIFFVSSIGIAKSNLSGDILRKSENKVSNEKNMTSEVTSEFNYLRFDVNNYSSENIEEMPDNTFNYLRFDVNNFVGATGSDITELPVSNEFEYLRFDVNNFSYNSPEINELPVNEFDYLRFDVNHYDNTYTNNEMPVIE